jgi:2-polyprenyl-3-methyl-5-hydroxy-6-metoxy-1,4-benzoquinol methylase
MSKKGNFVKNWDNDYHELKETYDENAFAITNLLTLIQNEFVLEDIQKYLGAKESLKILEVGCGGARTSVYLARRGYNTTCTDNSVEAVRLAMANFESAGASGNVVSDDLFNSNLEKEAYDCVMSFGLLEHFEDLEPLIKSIDSFLRPGGIHIHCVITKKFSTLTLMNIVYYPFRFTKNVIRGNFNGIFSKSFRDFPHYENEYSYRVYCAEFERIGNEILRCEAGGVIYPFIHLPLGVGKFLVKNFGTILHKWIRSLDRKQNHVLHLLAPTFTIISRKR